MAVEVKVQWPEAAVPASPATPFHVLLRSNAPLPVTLASLRVELASPAATYTVVHVAPAAAPPPRRVGAHVAWIGLTPFQPVAGRAAALEAQGALTIEPNRIYVVALAVDTTAVREAKVRRRSLCACDGGTRIRAKRARPRGADAMAQCASVTLALGEAAGHVDLVYRIAERPAPAPKARPSTWLPEPPPADADPGTRACHGHGSGGGGACADVAMAPPCLVWPPSCSGAAAGLPRGDAARARG